MIVCNRNTALESSPKIFPTIRKRKRISNGNSRTDILYRLEFRTMMNSNSPSLYTIFSIRDSRWDRTVMLLAKCPSSITRHGWSRTILKTSLQNPYITIPSPLNKNSTGRPVWHDSRTWVKQLLTLYIPPIHTFPLFLYFPNIFCTFSCFKGLKNTAYLFWR